MKALQGTGFVVGVLLSAAVSAGAQTPVGALAVDERQGDQYGWAVDFETAGAARAAALRECGAGCSVVLTFERCAAYAADQDANSTAVGWGESYGSAEGARGAALSECGSRGGSGCMVRAWGCNGPVVEEGLGLDRPARREIQQGLQVQGFDAGGADGMFGPRTRAAIRSWQSSQGARATGYLNSASVAALRRSTVGQPTFRVRVRSPAAATAQPPSSPAIAEQENLFWQSIMNSQNPAEFEAYLAQFPNGVFRALAEARRAGLRPPGGAGDDHGDSREAATRVEVESATPGVLEEPDDTDYFQIEVATAGSLLVETTGLTDTVGRLVGSGVSIDQDNADDDDENFWIRSIVSPGTHYVRVRGYDDTATGSYMLHVSHDDDDHSDIVETATRIELGSSTRGVVETRYDLDAFSIDVPTAGVLTVETTGNTDTVGILVGCGIEDGVLDDDGGDGLNFRIRERVSPDLCFISVSGIGTGSYTLHVSHDSGAIIDPDGTGIDFGDDSSEWANDGECDDTRFTGDDDYIGIEFGDGHVRRDASDCRSLFNQGRIRLK